MTMKRREFLGSVAAGGTLLTVPVFLASCAAVPLAKVTEPTPADPFMDWFAIDETIVRRLMTALTVNGADIADIYFQHRRSTTVSYVDGQITRSDIVVEQGVGFRVVAGGQTGFAYTEELTAQSMLVAAQAAAAIAQGDAAVLSQALNPVAHGALYSTSVPWSEIDDTRKLPLLQLAEQEARAADETVSGVTITLSDEDERVLIATLDGRLVSDHRPMTRMSVQASAARGDQTESGFASIAAREDISWYSNEQVSELARRAVDRTLILFDARRAPSGDIPVILAAGGCGILLHEAIGHSLEADLNRSGASPYADRMGDRIAGSTVSIVDQGTMPRARGSLNFDDEGRACTTNTLVENGILRSYLHDALSGSQYGVESTSSARRQSFRHAPMPRMTCTYMQDGPHSPQEIIAGVKLGIVANTITTGRAELGEGNFRFNVRDGWLVENGKKTLPLKDFQLSGNGPELLQQIAMVGNDSAFDKAGWSCGKNGQTVPVSQGMPSVLVPAMAVTPRTA